MPSGSGPKTENEGGKRRRESRSLHTAVPGSVIRAVRHRRPNRKRTLGRSAPAASDGGEEGASETERKDFPNASDFVPQPLKAALVPRERQPPEGRASGVRDSGRHGSEEPQPANAFDRSGIPPVRTEAKTKAESRPFPPAEYSTGVRPKPVETDARKARPACGSFPPSQANRPDRTDERRTTRRRQSERGCLTSPENRKSPLSEFIPAGVKSLEPDLLDNSFFIRTAHRELFPIRNSLREGGGGLVSQPLFYPYCSCRTVPFQHVPRFGRRSRTGNSRRVENIVRQTLRMRCNPAAPTSRSRRSGTSQLP